MRATDSLLSTNGQFTKILAPSKNTNGTLTTSVAQGSDGYALMSNGTQVYWGNVATDTTGLLPKSGGTMTGTLKLKDIVGTSGTVGTYGTTLPTGLTSNDAGRIFFQISDPYYEIPAGGTIGQALIKAGGVNERSYTWGNVASSVNAVAEAQHSLYVCGVYKDTTQDGVLHYNTNVYIDNDVLQGAAWNDYAEYRAVKEDIKAGHCIVENGDGTLSLSTKRLQSGAEIISDTYGMIIGRTDEKQAPVAITGRVLAYMYEPLNELKIGAPVCSGPNGTISQMTEEEARNYPWVIIGTISSIPKEKTWNNIEIDGRVWIRVR